MVAQVDIVNLALQALGTRTTVSAVELLAASSNEAIQANLAYLPTRDSLLRMAPWNCGTTTQNLVYVTSVPGTPENTSPATNLWQPGQPPPPWAYEYQYPVDCLRPVKIIPSIQTGFAGGVPITTAVTGGASTMWLGGPIRYVVQTDNFYPVTAAAVQVGGTNYAVGDLITLAAGLSTNPPIGAPVILQVLTAPGGVIATVSVVSQMPNADTSPLGGSYFAIQTNPVVQGSTTGLGSGATFNLTFGPQAPQRVILTNQEFATLAYVKQVSDPNLWDPEFQEAMEHALAARLVMALTGDKSLANISVNLANAKIIQARKDDGNEGLTINDVTPDWIRTRGLWWTDAQMSGPYIGFDWGGLIPAYF